MNGKIVSLRHEDILPPLVTSALFESLRPFLIPFHNIPKPPVGSRVGTYH